jgi:tetrahedral aminopeptidase
MQELMQRLAAAFGVSGFEEEIRDVIRGELEGVVDELRTDVLGNLIAVRKGTGRGKRVMLAAHMDQIGLMVTHVDEKGFLRFTNVGYIPALASWGGQVRFADGTVGTVGLDGKVNSRNTLPELGDMYIDTGASGKEAVRQKVGDVAVFWPNFTAQGDAWFSPNLDDRAGCLVLLQFLKESQGHPMPHDIHAVFTTQEEVGLRGAGTSAFAVDPEIAIALDVTGTGDTPYARTMAVSLGKGVAIKVQDGGMIGHTGLNRLLIAAAEEASIPYQMEVLLGGTTDARAMQTSRGGVPATALSIPCRHIHTPSEVVNTGDVAAAIALLRAFLAKEILL